MAYPGTINSIPARTDGSDQIIYAAHMNAIRTALLDLVTALGNTPQGNLASVELRLDGVADDDGKPKPPTNVLFVAKSGCKYSTIQSAIDASSPSSTNPVVILVFPGTYTETITGKSYCFIVGLYQSSVKVIAPALSRCIVANGGAIINIDFDSEVENVEPLYCVSPKALTMKNCMITSSAADVFKITGGTLLFYDCVLSNPNDMLAINFVDGIIYGYDSEFRGGPDYSIDMAGGVISLVRCLARGGTGCVNVGVAASAYLRFCLYNNPPTGAGSIDIGIMDGSNSSDPEV